MRIRTVSCLLLFLLGAGLVHAAPSDTTRADVSVSVWPKPEAFYSPARGFGAGVDVTIRNLGWDASTLRLSATTMTRHGEYSAFLFTDDPFEAPLFGGLGLRYVGTRAYRFFGVGPRSQREDAIGFGARRMEAEARLGWTPLPGLPLMLQPAVRLLHTHMRWFEEVEEGALDRLGPASAASVLRAIGEPSTGASVELAAIVDLFDEPRYPTRGALFQLAGRRYRGLDRDPFNFHQVSFIANAAFPVVGQRTVVETRALMTVTRPIDSERPIPFFALPTLEADVLGGYPNYRMVGRDLLALSAGLRFPVLEIFGFASEGFIAVHVANAYDDLFAQFEPRISFDGDLSRTGVKAPLRPALSLGGHIVDLGEGRPIISGQIGFSPEGFQLADLRFVIDLRTRRPPVR
jgi:hypothetical protein